MDQGGKIFQTKGTLTVTEALESSRFRALPVI